MAHKKAGGSSRNGRDSHGRRLGVKKFGGERVVREISSFVSAGPAFIRASDVGMGEDHTLFALTGGTVQFQDKANGPTFR
jgi:large subunit ribosomal protein L27